jgi:hypothetical protein
MGFSEKSPAGLLVKREPRISAMSRNKRLSLTALLRLLRFTLLAGLVFLASTFTGCEDPKKRNPLLCDVGTATFERPLGWDAKKTEWPTLSLLTPSDVPRDLMTRMISIDAARPEQKTADVTAVDFAMKYKGILLPDPTELDGERAYWVIANGQLGKFQPTHVVIAHHKGQAYYILGGSSDRSDLSSDVQAIVKSWKWKK